MKRRAQPWLGTMVEIAIADRLADADSISCFDSAFAAVAEVHRLMSFHNPASDVSRINRAPVGEGVEVSPHTWEVLNAASSVSKASGAAFDIACAPRLVECGYLPMPDAVLPGYVPQHAALILDANHRVRKACALWIDLGGIAKGYAVDMAVAALKRCGVCSACVNAGGDLRAFGEAAFPVFIRNPRSPGEIALELELLNSALASSANYFSRTATGGSVLVDGRNGQPCAGDFSVSVRASACMVADALTKVVAATGDANHPALAHFSADAFII